MTERGHVADFEPLIPAELVVRDPDICGGRPTMRGTRILAENVHRELAGGMSWMEILEWWPSIPVPAAESSPEPPTGPETGTGEAGPEKGAQAAGLIPADLIESNPDIRGGEPCMKGTRVPAADVAGLLADGLGWHQVHGYWPSVQLPAGTACTGRACDCRWGPAEKAVDHYLHGDGGSTQLCNTEIADITRIVTRHAYLEVADSLDRLGHHDAARAVRSAAKDLEDEGATP